MGRFRFALQPLLDQRERVERERQIEVAGLEAQRLALEASLTAAHRTGQEERAVWRQAVGGHGEGVASASIDLNAARQQAYAVVAADARAREVAEELTTLLKSLGAARARLAQAAKDRRAMELLRDRRREEWLATINKKERDFLDELGVRAAWVGMNGEVTGGLP